MVSRTVLGGLMGLGNALTKVGEDMEKRRQMALAWAMEMRKEEFKARERRTEQREARSFQAQRDVFRESSANKRAAFLEEGRSARQGASIDAAKALEAIRHSNRQEQARLEAALQKENIQYRDLVESDDHAGFVEMAGDDGKVYIWRIDKKGRGRRMFEAPKQRGDGGGGASDPFSARMSGKKTGGSAAAAAPEDKTYTEADILRTMAESGLEREDVVRRLEAKGFRPKE